MRKDGRDFFNLRPVQIVSGAMPYAEGSAEISFGGTRVLCSASVEGKDSQMDESKRQGVGDC